MVDIVGAAMPGGDYPNLATSRLHAPRFVSVPRTHTEI
jgi:hypothetical protein